MLTDLQQKELDLAEEKVIRSMFNGSLEPSPVVSLALNTFKIDPNKYIQEFEGRIKPYLDGAGLVDGTKLKNALQTKYPKVARWVPLGTFRLADVVDELIILIRGV